MLIGLKYEKRYIWSKTESKVVDADDAEVKDEI